jgi:choline dehydrogenase
VSTTDGFDTVIVGGGSAGATLATRLTEPGRSGTVLLLEAGGDGPLPSDADLLANVSFALTARDWGLTATVTADGRQLDYPQGKFVGGGSSVNGGLALRGLPSDYDGWAADGNPSWGWASMLPCLRRLEADQQFGADTEIHRADGPIPITRYAEADLLPIQQGFRKGCEAVGFPWAPDLNRPGSTGVGPLPMNRHDGVRMSTALGYLKPALDRPALTVRGGVHVVRVVVEGGRAVGVEVLGPDGAVSRVDAGRVVVSAGSLATPGILWRSGIGPGAALRSLGIPVVADNPAVGQNLHDHPGIFLFARPGADVGPVDPQYQLGVRYSSGVADGTPEDMLMGLMNTFDLTYMPALQPIVGGTTAVVVTCGVHEPRSRGRLTLTSPDPLAPPAIEFDLCAHPDDVTRLVDGLRRCRDVLDAGLVGFTDGTVLVEDFSDDAALAVFVRSVVAGGYHPVGTCRMGPADRDGTVVGDDLSVHGVAGLSVADASIMPKIVQAPTNLTAIAIGERAAELLA